jgi:DNA-3-methyladenine glycosylase II
MTVTADSSFTKQYDTLAAADPVLAALLDKWGRQNPFRWAADDGASHGRGLSSNFDAMVLHIIRQQVSLAAADTIYDRVVTQLGGAITPASIAAATADDLRSAGLSRQKASYVTDLAIRHLEGTLNLDDMHDLSDTAATAALTAVRGVGRWTAEVFLIAQLHREDILPANDVGIRRAVQLAWQLDAMPTEKEVRTRGERWAPYRTFAAEALWFSLPEAHHQPPVEPALPAATAGVINTEAHPADAELGRLH